MTDHELTAREDRLVGICFNGGGNHRGFRFHFIHPVAGHNLAGRTERKLPLSDQDDHVFPRGTASQTTSRPECDLRWCE
jgi:hypothetical protein